MYSRTLIDLMNNDGEITGNEIDETIHVAVDEVADDVKIYIRHNTGENIREYQL